MGRAKQRNKEKQNEGNQTTATGPVCGAAVRSVEQLQVEYHKTV